MGNPTVKVSSDGKTLSLNPDPLTVAEQGVIVMWMPDPDSEVRSVDRVTITGWPADSQPAKQGINVLWLDPNEVAAEYKYTCEATLKDGRSLDVDPQIINTGGC